MLKMKPWLLKTFLFLFVFSIFSRQAKSEMNGGETTSGGPSYQCGQSLVNISSPQDGAYLRANVSVEVTYQKEINTLELYVDGGLYSKVEFSSGCHEGSCPSEQTYTFTLDTALYVDGEHLLQAIGYSQRGCKVDKSALVSVIIDNTLPIIKDESPLPDSFINNTLPQISAILQDVTSGIAPLSIVMDLDNAAISPDYESENGRVSYQPTSALSDGGHRVELGVKDIAGNLAEISWAFTVDTTPPKIFNLFPEEGSILADATPLISADFFDGISGVDPNTAKISLDGVDVSSDATITVQTVTYIPTMDLSDGLHTVLVEVKDKVGNYAGPVKRFFTTDVTPPRVIIEPVSSPTNVPTQVIAGSYIEERLSRIEVNGITAGIDTDLKRFSAQVDLSEGLNNIGISAFDLAGNTGFTQADVLLDTVPPQVTIDPITSPLNLSMQTIKGSYVEENLDNIKVNGVIADIDRVSSTYSTEITLNEGGNEIIVVARDIATNTAQVKTEIVLDTILPQISIEGLLNDSFVNTDVAGLITVTDEHLGVYTTTLNGEPYESGTTITAEGNYTLEVTAEDIAGNSLSKTLNFFIDKTVPLISVSGVSEGVSYDTEVLPEILVTDTNLDTWSVTLNGEVFETGTIVSDDGEYVLEVIAQDKAGNQSSQSITFSISRGGGLIPIEPIIPIFTDYVPDSPDPFSPNGDNNADTVTITYYLIEGAGSVTIKVFDVHNNLVRTLKDNLWETIGVYTVVWDGKDENGNILPDGIYPFEINAVDAEGNNVLNVQDTVTVDNHCIQLVEPSVGSTLSGKVIFKVLPSVYLEQYSRYNIFFTCYRIRPQGIEWIWQNRASRQADGSWQVSWDTTTVDNGDYEISIRVNYESDIPQDPFFSPGRYESIVGLKYTIDNGFIIGNVIDGPDAFSPNGDNNIDTMEINYLITKDAQVTIKLYDANNTLLRTLKDGILETRGNHTAVWDGRDQSENIVPEGTYTYKIDAIDAQGNKAVQRQGTTTIDNHFMRIVEPQPESSLAGEVCFKAIPSAYIHNEEEVRFFYRQKASSQWIQIGDAAKQADGSWQITWDTTGVVNGNYEIILYAHYFDLDNNPWRSEHTLAITYTVNNGFMLSNITDAPDAFSPNGDKNADTVAINYLINREGLVTIKLYDVNNTLVRTLKDNLWETKGTHSAVWDGKDDNGVVLVDGTYTYKIDATDAQGNKASQREGTITLDNHFMRIVEPQPATLLSKEVTFKAIPSPYIHSESIQFFYRAKGVIAWIRFGWGSWSIEGTCDVCWDTITVANGDYEIGISGYYYDLNNQRRDDFIVAGTYTVNNDFIITNVSDGPDAFSPNGDGRYDTTTINYLISQSGFVTIKLYDVNNNLIRTVKDNVFETAGEHTAVWDGKDGSGNLLNEGTYTYKIDGRDVQGYITFQVSGTITIDNHFMQIVEPPVGTTLVGEVSLKAIPSLFIHNEYYVDFYYRLKGKIEWVCIGRGIKTDDGSWKITWNTTTIANGDYEIMLTTSYKDLNNQWRGENTLSISYLVDNGITISSVSDSPDAFSPNGDGKYDTATINYLITKDGLVTIRLYDINNNLTRTLKDSLWETKGNHTAVWDGKDDNGVVLVDGIYTYKIDAIDAQGNKASQREGTITLDNHFMRIVEPIPGTTLMGKVTFTAVPSPYTPNEPSIYFCYRPKGADGWIYIDCGRWETGGSSKVCWDTTKVANGDYEIGIGEVGVISIGGGGDYYESKSEFTVAGTYTVNNGFFITNVLDAPDAFSPNNDGQYDSVTINYLITNDALVTINLYDADNNLVRLLKDNLLETGGSHTAVWDGRENQGNLLPEGTYTYTIDAIDTGGNKAYSQQGALTIDNHFMQIVEPQPGTPLTGEVNFKVIHSPYVFTKYITRYNVRFYYRQKETGNWVDLGWADYWIDDSWRINWDITKVANGDYEIRISGGYADLNNRWRNEYTLPLTYTVYNEGPEITNLTVTPNPFFPDESGTWIDSNTGEVFNDPGPNRILDDIAVISFTASDEGFFNIGIFDSNEQVVRQLVYQVLYPDLQTNQIEVQWDGRNNQGNFVKNGQYRLVVNAGSIAKEKSIMIGVDKKSFITNLKVTPNPFSPNRDGIDEITTLSYDLSENSYVTVEIYNLEDILLRTLVNNQYLPYGACSHIWNGKDDGGIVLPKGRYTIKITAQAETGNVSTPAFINVSLAYIISNVYFISRGEEINPYLGETTTINYTLSTEAVLSIKIYNYQDNLVRTLISNTPYSPGIHLGIWDGRDDNNHIVPDGLYYFIIEDSINGAPSVVYDPRGTGGKDISNSISLTAANFNPLLNQFCVLTYNLPQMAKINLKVRSYRYGGPAVRVIKYQELAGPGQQQAFWDGRDEAGNFFNYANFTFAIWGYTVDENSILVVGGQPQLLNTTVSPVRFTPYINPYTSVGNPKETSISFDLSRESNVTINIYNPSGKLVRSLVNDSPCSQGQNSFIWDGKDDAGVFLVNGYYRIVIHARYEDNYSEPRTLHSEIY